MYFFLKNNKLKYKNMFKIVKQQLQDNFQKMLSLSEHLFYVTIDREVIWDNYLQAFELEEQQSHNCNCCKSFLRQYAGIISIIDGKRVSIWDNMEVPDEYKASILNLSNYIHSLPITDVFVNESSKCGTAENFDAVRQVTWNHFALVLPNKFVKKLDLIDSFKGSKRTNKEMLQRALSELTIDAVDTVLDLIAQNSLYRGKESESILIQFSKLQKEFSTVTVSGNVENFLWLKSLEIPEALCRVRNTAIGTLLIDLSEGRELDSAVTAFEKVVAPSNYKRPTALVTPKMIESAKDKLIELGLIDSLERRFANETDLSVEDIIYTDKSSSITDVFGDMAKETLVNPKSLSKIEEISAKDFVEKVIPTSKSIEVLLENNHLPNMVSLITSVNSDAKSLFKWNNNFSWSYTGGITDSIKEKVKAAGGNVDGELRVSLSWFNYDDLDIHVTEPNGNRIFFNNRISLSRGQLDVDMNAGGRNSRTPVENIVLSMKDRMLDGNYKVEVNNFAKRESMLGGFIVQIECRGEIVDFEYDKSPADSGTINVVEFNYSKVNGITFKNDVKSNVISKEKWGVKTNQFTKVKKIMYSPNYWENPTGNKHYMFFLENCISDEIARPFFNEFLKQEFDENRKVLEIMGGKMKVEHTDNQLSGVGFSETQRNHLIVKVDGNFKRMLKVNF